MGLLDIKRRHSTDTQKTARACHFADESGAVLSDLVQQLMNEYHPQVHPLSSLMLRYNASKAHMSLPSDMSNSILQAVCIGMLQVHTNMVLSIPQQTKWYVPCSLKKQ